MKSACCYVARSAPNLDCIDAEWREHKGLLSSTFVVKTTDARWREIVAWVDDVNAP